VAEENKMAYFAPALIGAGLLASVFWFGGGQRKLPREFGEISQRRLKAAAKTLGVPWSHIETGEDSPQADAVVRLAEQRDNKAKKRLSREFGSLGGTKSEALERDLVLQHHILRNALNAAQRDRAKRRIKNLEAQIKEAVQGEFGSLGAWPKGSRKNWNKNHKLAKGTSVRVYDNGGETTDRYTVVMVGKKWDGLLYPGEKTALGMDEGGLSFSQWTGVHEGKHLGRRVKWEDLPRATRGHIERRVLQD
jgi:hypothetical protein